MPAVPPLVRRPSSEAVRTEWTFNSGDDECAAVAAATGISFTVTVRRNAPVRLVVTLAAPVHGPASTPLRFEGPAGAWLVAARHAGARQFAVVLGSDETALSRVLVLLSGGVLELGESVQPIVSLAIGPSDEQGQSWFDCARHKML